MRAGYTRNARAAKVQASRLLRRANIAKAIATRTEAILTKLGFTQELVVKALYRHVLAAACADVRALFDEHGNARPIHTLTEVQAGQIARYEITIKKAKAGHGMSHAHAGDGMTDKLLKVKLKNFDKVLELALRYFGLIQDKPAETERDEAAFIALLQSARQRTKHLRKGVDQAVDLTPEAKKALPPAKVKPSKSPAK